MSVTYHLSLITYHLSLRTKKISPGICLRGCRGRAMGGRVGAVVAKLRRPGENYEADCNDVATFVNVVFALVPID